jgi:hypothetical protein
MVAPSFYQCFAFHIMPKKFLDSHVSRIFYPIDHFINPQEKFNPEESWILCSGEMLNYNLNAQGGFTPAAVAPPMQ